MEEIYRLMLPVWESTPQDDRYYTRRKEGMDALAAFRDGTYSLFGERKEPRPPEVIISSGPAMDRAKQLINEYCRGQSWEDADYSDLRSVGVAYTTITDDELEVQVNVNLVDFRLDRYVDGVLVE